MILGTVNANREAVIQIAVFGRDRVPKSIRAVIDTGYTGDLMLPKYLVESLGLTVQGRQPAMLGDGTVKIFRMYAGSIIWDGQTRRIEINSSESEALVGMGLLEDYKLEIEARYGGTVRISALD
jgi:clan AA aspartic protease